MSETVKTFAELLRQFALSVDIVGEATFNRVREYVVQYMKSELEAAYFGLMTRSVIDDQPGLQTTWSSADQGSATSIMLPLVRVGRPLGVLYLESTAHVEATPVGQKELEMLAEAIATLIQLRD